MTQMYESLRPRKKLGTNAISEELGGREIEEAEFVETEQTEEEPVEILEEKIRVPLRRRKYESIHGRKKRGVGFIEPESGTSSTHRKSASVAIAEAEIIVKEFGENHRAAIETLGKAKLSFDIEDLEKALNYANATKLLASRGSRVGK